MRRIFVLGLGFLWLLNIWGCANTQPTHFYLLRAIDSSPDSTSLEVNNPGVSLGLGPITRSQIFRSTTDCHKN